MTSFEDCRRELLVRGGPAAQSAYRAWLARPGYEAVHEFVHSFTHTYLASVTPKELADVRSRSAHALGDVRTEEQLQEVEDWTTPFAFQHLFHRFLETERHAPTWQEFSAWLNGDAAAFFVQPLLSHVGWDEAGKERRVKLRRAFRWRLGKFYYSAMRELELFARLRHEYGLPLRYHLLADVLLRVDFWLNGDVVCVYFANPKYRDRDQGRKPPAERFLSTADPLFNIHHVAIERQGYGNFWVPDDASIRKLAKTLGA